MRTQQQQKASCADNFGYYMAANNSQELNSFLTGKGFAPARTVDDLAFKINHYITQGGDAALDELARLHPDRDLIMQNNMPAPQANNFLNATGNGGYHNCSGGGYNSCQGGCSSCGGAKAAPPRYSNAEGGTPAVPGHAKENALNVIAILAVIGLVAIVTMKGTFNRA